MARARNIKPSTFKNELLGTADPLLTILFISLWCLADKAGRLEDRPLRIKAETFPYREGVDVNGYLTELARLDFIVRYELDGQRLIQVKNFAVHQNPHHTERASVLPCFSETCHVTVNPPLDTRPTPSDSLLLNKKEEEKPDATASLPSPPKKQKKKSDPTTLQTRPDLEKTAYLAWLAAKSENSAVDVHAIFNALVKYCKEHNEKPNRRRLLNWITRERDAMPMDAIPVSTVITTVNHPRKTAADYHRESDLIEQQDRLEYEAAQQLAEGTVG